jgi:hypothetical protein
MGDMSRHFYGKRKVFDIWNTNSHVILGYVITTSGYEKCFLCSNLYCPLICT